MAESRFAKAAQAKLGKVDSPFAAAMRKRVRRETEAQLPGGATEERGALAAGQVIGAAVMEIAGGEGGPMTEMVSKAVMGEAPAGVTIEQAARMSVEERARRGTTPTEAVVGTLAAKTAAKLRGVGMAASLASFEQDRGIEAFARGMQQTTVLGSDDVMTNLTSAVTQGPASMAEYMLLSRIPVPGLAAASFFLEGAGASAFQIEEAALAGEMPYSRARQALGAAVGGGIESATEMIGGKIAAGFARTTAAEFLARGVGKTAAGRAVKGFAGGAITEGIEEGAASLSTNYLRKPVSGEKIKPFGEALEDAWYDSLYGSVGGAGAQVVGVPIAMGQESRVRRRISDALAKSQTEYSDPAYWERIAPTTVGAMQGMTEAERMAEVQASEEAAVQARGDIAVAQQKAATLVQKQADAAKKIAAAKKKKDDAGVQAAEQEMNAIVSEIAQHQKDMAVLAADKVAADTRLAAATAFMAQRQPRRVMSMDDVMRVENVTAANPKTDSDAAAMRELSALGYDVVFYDDAQPDRQAFFSPATPNTLYIRAGNDAQTLGEVIGIGFEEAIHSIQLTDGKLWQALRNSFDERSVLEAAVNYFGQQVTAEDRVAVASAAAALNGDRSGNVDHIMRRWGTALTDAEGTANHIRDGITTLFRTGRAPGLLGRVLARTGLRGRQAATALKVYDAMLKRERAAPAPTEMAGRLREAQQGIAAFERVEAEAKRRAQPAPSGAPSAPAAAPTAPPAPSAPAPVPPTAVPAAAPAAAPAVGASGMTPAEAAAAETPDFKAMVNLAVNNIRASDKKFAKGKRIYPIMEAMERDPASLSEEDREIGRRLQQEMYTEFGPEFRSMWARARRPASDIGHKREKATGRYVGAPDWVGGSPAKLKTLRTKLRQLAVEGEAGKMWYENSSRAILEITGGDVEEAERIVALIALYSPNATVPANTSMALTAYFQWKAGMPIDAGFAVADRKAEALLVRGQMWSGIKTNSFYQNLMVEIDPSKLDPGVATMDMWMALAFDYGSKALDQGPKYKFAEREIQRLADELGWKAHQVQAAIWTAMKGRIDPIRGALREREIEEGIGTLTTVIDPKTGKEKEKFVIPAENRYRHYRLAHEMGMAYALNTADIEQSKYDFSDALRDRMVQMSWEATPSTSTGRSLPGIHTAPLAQKFEYLQAVKAALTENNRDAIADMVGLPQGTTVDGFSAWLGDIGAGAQTFVPVPSAGAGKARKIKPAATALLDLAAAIRGLVMEQDSVVYHTPVFDDAKIRHNGVQLQTAKPLTEQDMRALYSGLIAKFGTQKLAPGYRPDGARILNFVKTVSNKDFQRGVREVLESLPDTFGGGTVEISSFRSDGDSIDNDWQRSPNGEDYRKRIEARRPDLLQRVADLRSRVEAVNRDFGAKYGWGPTAVLSARRRGAARDGMEQPAVGALSPLAGAPRINGFTGPDPAIVAVAERYAAANGIDFGRQSEYVDVDVDRARRIAAAYDAMRHNPQDPRVAAAYAELIRQTRAQYDALVEAGYQFYFFDPDNDPYAGQPGGFGNPYNAVRDLRANKRMAVFPTESGFGSGATDIDVSNNPLLADTGLQWAYGTPDGQRKRVTANDLFRAVHDAFGHSLEGAGFRARGEENAWQAHVRLFTGDAVGAMTSETRGQNSWLNFGPFGEQNQTAKVEDTTFADQKVGLMPDWTWQEGVSPSMQARRRASDADYLAAVERGDGETVERMVNEAAESAGYTLRRYHITPATFTTFRTPSEFTDEFGRDLLLSEYEGENVMNVFVRLGRTRQLTGELMWLADDKPALAKWMDENGLDSVTIPSNWGIADDIIIRNPQDIKSAELVTYDDSFKLIPLSRRFDVAETDIRMARRPRELSEFTPEWRAWFGDSKVVDEQGRPLVVYHGTNAEFDVFATTSQSVNETTFGPVDVERTGIFFTNNPNFASQYGRNIMPVYLSMQDPVTITRKLVLDFADTIDAFGPDRDLYLTARSSSGWRLFDGDVGRRFVAFLKDQGYDGAIFSEDLVIDGDSIESTTYVAFDSNQAKSIFNERPTQAPGISAARRRVPPAEIKDAGKRLTAARVALEAARKTGDEAKISEARKEFKSALRGLRSVGKIDAPSLAFAIGRRAGQVAGMMKGRKMAAREVRDVEQAKAAAKREELRSKFKNRMAAFNERLDREVARNDALRVRMERARRLAELRRDEAAERAERKALKAWFAGQAKGAAAGWAEAKKEMVEIRKQAAEIISSLPRSMRGKYVDALATMRTPSGIAVVARRVMQDLYRAEAIETVSEINRLRKRVKKVGLRADTRAAIKAQLDTAFGLLATGKKRLLPFTDSIDLRNRIISAKQALANAQDAFDLEREEYRAGRDGRAEEIAADSAVLGATINTLTPLPAQPTASRAPQPGIVRQLLTEFMNMDAYTLMQRLEGGESGVLGKMWNQLKAGKNAMTVARRAIDESIDGSLRRAGYAGYDGYAARAAGLYGDTSAETVTVRMGGVDRMIPVDMMLNIAAFDEDTVALLTDGNDPESRGSPIVFSTYRKGDPILLTQQEHAAIVAGLTAQQRALIEDMKAILEERIRPMAFEIYFQINGRQPDAVPGYFPRQRLGDEIGDANIDINMDPTQVVSTMLSNAGFLKERVAARSTLVVSGLMRTMDSHIDESLRLIHLSLPLRYAMSVLKTTPVRTSMERVLGDGANDAVRKLVLNGVGLSGRPTNDLIEKLNSNVSGALISLNPKTWIRQLGGAFRLSSEMSPTALAEGSARSLAMTLAQRKERIAYIEGLNGYLYDRHRRSQIGIFANVLGDPRTGTEQWVTAMQATGRSLATLGESAAAGDFMRAAQALREGTMTVGKISRSADGVIRAVDRQIMLVAFEGFRSDLKRRNPGMADVQVDRMAAQMAEDAFRRTQNVSDSLDDTLYAAVNKFNKGIGRVLFPFSSDPLKGHNQLRRAIMSGDPAQIGRTTAGIAGNMALAAAVNPLWALAGLAVANLFGGDEEDEEIIRRMLMEREMKYSASALAADAVSAVAGYSGIIASGLVEAAMSSPEMADDVMEPLAIRMIGDAAKQAAAGRYGEVTGTALQLGGVPVVSPIRTIVRTAEQVRPPASRLLTEYRKREREGTLTPAQRRRMAELERLERIRKATQPSP